MGELVGLLYLVGFLPSWLTLARSGLIAMESDGAGINNDDRALAAFLTFFAAAAWPVALTVRQVWRWVRRTDLLHTPNEITEAKEQELQQLRALARKHGLPMPDVPPTD